MILNLSDPNGITPEAARAMVDRFAALMEAEADEASQKAVFGAYRDDRAYYRGAAGAFKRAARIIREEVAR